jgi:hypothetical protein
VTADLTTIEDMAPMADPASLGERFLRPTTRMVGLYQTLLRQQITHFFPDSTLEVEGDRGTIRWTYLQDIPNYRLAPQSDGVGVLIEWFGTRYQFYPGHPSPLRTSERRLLETITRYLDLRFQGLMELATGDSPELFAYAMEDLIITEYLAAPGAFRVPAALEALRVAALTTYEDRRVSSGALLLGTDKDPAFPEKATPRTAPRYHVGMSVIKSLHRICDGLNTLFVVDRKGKLARAVDLERWVERARVDVPVPAPCPRRFLRHAQATASGNHVCLVLTPSQEIKLFMGGMLAFTFGSARWRLLDIPSKYNDWKTAIGDSARNDLARTLFQAALNLADMRTGALFVVLRDPENALGNLVAPGDRITAEPSSDDDSHLDDAHLNPRLAKRVLHQLVTGYDLHEIDDTVLESLAGVDGALVTDGNGRLHAFGAILRTSAEAVHAARGVDGARSVAALAASFYGPVLKVSQDGMITMYLSGRRVWEL